MIQEIMCLDQTFGLCRTVAGYARKWKLEKIPSLLDVRIKNYTYRWNSTAKDWVNATDSVNKIGCIHTV